MKPHSVNYFVAILAVTGLLLLTLIGLNMVYEIRTVEQTFSQSHTDSAQNELRRGIGAVITKANDIAAKIADWDETSQQLTDPTYYRFWRQRRVHAVQFIPGYVHSIELYGANGDALLPQEPQQMPQHISENLTYLVSDNQRPWLYMFKPIMLHDSSSAVFGYVGLKLDFMAALLELNLFTHLDTSSMVFNVPPVSQVSPSTIIDHAQVKELHQGELDQLKSVVYRTFGYIVALIVAILFVLYWMVMALFARPLIRLNQHIESIKGTAKENIIPVDTLYFSVDELNNFARSLQEYQLRLQLTQENLQRLNSDLEQRVKNRTQELQTINKELEAFSYSVSHDLRAPLRSIDGYSQALLEDYQGKLDDSGKHFLIRIRANAQRMAQLIDDLLILARIARIEMRSSLVNLSDIAHKKFKQLREQQPERAVTIHVADDLYTHGDEQLLTVVMDNLLSNAWKYTGKTSNPMIEFGCSHEQGQRVFYVKDNGTGFDMQYVDKVFEVFQRLHGSEFEGTGVGLATVSRIIKRHQGRIWAHAELGKGACFYFTIGSD